MRRLLLIVAALVILSACDSIADRTLRGQIEAINTGLPVEAAKDIVFEPLTINDSSVTLNFSLTSATADLRMLRDTPGARQHLVHTLGSRNGMAAMFKLMKVSKRDLRVCYRVTSTGDSTVFTIPAAELR